MKTVTAVALVLSLGIYGGSVSATPDSAERRLGRGESVLVPGPGLPTIEEASLLAEEPKQVLCSYLLYGSRQFVCGPPPIEDLQKKCDEKATSERGEKATCQCTDDPHYIRDTCD